MKIVKYRPCIRIRTYGTRDTAVEVEKQISGYPDLPCCTVLLKKYPGTEYRYVRVLPPAAVTVADGTKSSTRISISKEVLTTYLHKRTGAAEQYHEQYAYRYLHGHTGTGSKDVASDEERRTAN